MNLFLLIAKALVQLIVFFNCFSIRFFLLLKKLCSRILLLSANQEMFITLFYWRHIFYTRIIQKRVDCTLSAQLESSFGIASNTCHVACFKALYFSWSCSSKRASFGYFESVQLKKGCSLDESHNSLTSDKTSEICEAVVTIENAFPWATPAYQENCNQCSGTLTISRVCTGEQPPFLFVEDKTQDRIETSLTSFLPYEIIVKGIKYRLWGKIQAWNKAGDHFMTMCVKEDSKGEEALLWIDNLASNKIKRPTKDPNGYKRQLLSTSKHVDVMLCYKKI
jgi:hypothetical protein